MSTCIEVTDSLVGGVFSGFEEDAIRITENNAVLVHADVNDTVGVDEAHCDGIQLIPPKVFTHREQFALGEISGVVIASCRINSPGQLQGIFCSDGLVRDTRIYFNKIQTKSPWVIMFRGFMSGRIVGNIDGEGKPCRVDLKNARVGGNAGDGELEILSFLDPCYTYSPLEEITNDTGSFVDERGIPTNLNSSYLTDFDIHEFRKELGSYEAPRKWDLHAKLIKEIARKHGNAFSW